MPGRVPIFIDVFVEANPNTSEECGLRFKAESEPRVVSRVRLDGRDCALAGWSSAGGGSACEARAAKVEDSSAGSAILIYGGDWGLRLTPDGGEPFGEPYLLLANESIVG
ncbi:MAG TPA: hypothetical protein VFF06_12045 [Polyangia bacterium]|nr:hypothetical protein [Polyangia bacterium]